MEHTDTNSTEQSSHFVIGKAQRFISTVLCQWHIKQKSLAKKLARCLQYEQSFQHINHGNRQHDKQARQKIQSISVKV